MLADGIWVEVGFNCSLVLCESAGIAVVELRALASVVWTSIVVMLVSV